MEFAVEGDSNPCGGILIRNLGKGAIKAGKILFAKLRLNYIILRIERYARFFIRLDEVFIFSVG